MSLEHKLSLVFTCSQRGLDDNAVRSLRTDLDLVHSMLDGADFPIYLVGGLGLAVRSSSFYRNHRDIDLAVFAEDLPQLADLLGQSGYRLGHQVFSAFLTASYRLQAARALDSPHIVDPENARVRAYLRGGPRVRLARRRADYFDIFLLSRSEAGVVLHGYDVTVPWEAWHPTRPFRADSPVSLPNAAYRQHIGAKGRKQRRDFQQAGLDVAPSGMAS